MQEHDRKKIKNNKKKDQVFPGSARPKPIEEFQIGRQLLRRSWGPRKAPRGAGPMLMNSDDDGLWVRSPTSSGAGGGRGAFIFIINQHPLTLFLQPQFKTTSKANQKQQKYNNDQTSTDQSNSGNENKIDDNKITMSHLQQIEQAKQGLLVYLQANRQYIEQTVYNVFNVECIQQKTLDTLDIDKMKKTIKDIFDFGDNRVYQYFFSHMESNIKAYIKQEYAHKAAKDYYVLDVEKLTDIVKFCIVHGFNFEAAKKQDQEDKKKEEEKNKKEEPAPIVKPRPPSPQPPSPPPPPKKFYYVEPERPPPPPIIDQPIPVFDNVKPKIANKLDPSLIPEKKEFKLQKYPMPEKHVLPRYLMSKPKAETVPKEQQTLPIVAPIDQNYLIHHRKTIRQRLVKLFNFYCFQQSSLGVRPTFDHIKGQGELMSIGNFMQFCQYTKVFSCKEMTKDMLMIQFKKTAEGRIQIDFQTFEKLVQQLDEKYLKFLEHDPSNNPIPTYEARLMLNEPTKLGQLKKDRHLIFGTKAKEGRELFDRKPSKSARYETKELTGHSGRFSDELENGLKLKSLEKSSEKPKAKRVKKNNGSINLSDLTKIRLPKLPWIDEEDDTDVKVKFGKKLM